MERIQRTIRTTVLVSETNAINQWGWNYGQALGRSSSHTKTKITRTSVRSIRAWAISIIFLLMVWIGQSVDTIQLTSNRFGC